MVMSQDVESIYDEYISKLKQALPNVDPNFVHRIMYLERKLVNEDVSEAEVSAIIEYKSGTDMNNKENGLHVVSRMKVSKIKEIASDRDIVKISGKADSGLGE